MPAAAGWGAAQGQVSPGGKSFPFRSRFSLQTLWAQLHRQLSPSGASLLPYCSPCSLPAWLPPPCLLTIASLMLSNCRTYCLCSAAPALGLRGPRKRQATKQGQSTEKGRGGRRKQELKIAAFQLFSDRFVLGCFHLEGAKGRTHRAWGSHTLSIWLWELGD